MTAPGLHQLTLPSFSSAKHTLYSNIIFWHLEAVWNNPRAAGNFFRKLLEDRGVFFRRLGKSKHAACLLRRWKRRSWEMVDHWGCLQYLEKYLYYPLKNLLQAPRRQLSSKYRFTQICLRITETEVLWLSSITDRQHWGTVWEGEAGFKHYL